MWLTHSGAAFAPHSQPDQVRRAAGIVDGAFTLIRSANKKLMLRYPAHINLSHVLGDGMMADHNEVTVSSRHLRAICEEIGYRIRLHLDRTSTDPSPQLRSLLLRFEQSERIESPSIVPSVGDVERSESPSCDEVAGW